MPSVRFLCVGQTSTSFSAFTLSTHFRGTTVASPHRRSAVPTYPPHGLDVFPRHAAEGLGTTRHPVLNLSRSSLPIQVIGPIPHPPTTGKPLQAHHEPSLCAHRNRCQRLGHDLHQASSRRYSTSVLQTSVMLSLLCGARTRPPRASPPRAPLHPHHRARRNRGPQSVDSDHNNLGNLLGNWVDWFLRLFSNGRDYLRTPSVSDSPRSIIRRSSVRQLRRPVAHGLIGSNRR